MKILKMDQQRPSAQILQCIELVSMLKVLPIGQNISMCYSKPLSLLLLAPPSTQLLDVLRRYIVPRAAITSKKDHMKRSIPPTPANTKVEAGISDGGTLSPVGCRPVLLRERSFFAPSRSPPLEKFNRPSSILMGPSKFICCCFFPFRL